MKWYPNLYVGKIAKKRQRTIIRKLKTNAGMLDVYLITMAANGRDIFDIISSSYLQQRSLRRNLPMIVGIACGYEEAVELAADIVQEIYQETKDVQVRSYLMEKVKERM